VCGQTSNQFKTTVKIIVLSILIFIF
jgi:hypothetical protein